MSRADIERLADTLKRAAVEEEYGRGYEFHDRDAPEIVRAILEAMREQTESQYDAICATGKMWREQTSQTVWQTHIDALLSD